MLDDIKIYGNKGSRLNDIKSLNILTPALFNVCTSTGDCK